MFEERLLHNILFCVRKLLEFKKVCYCIRQTVFCMMQVMSCITPPWHASLWYYRQVITNYQNIILTTSSIGCLRRSPPSICFAICVTVSKTRSDPWILLHTVTLVYGRLWGLSHDIPVKPLHAAVETRDQISQLSARVRRSVRGRGILVVPKQALTFLFHSVSFSIQPLELRCIPGRATVVIGVRYGSLSLYEVGRQTEIWQ